MLAGTRRRAQAGYNLVEVLVALAMTGVVILSVMTLFALGQRNVYSGRQMTAANAVATRVLEDLSLMAAYDLLTNFGLNDTTTFSTNTVAGTTFAGSVLRATDGTIDATTDPGGYLARWQPLVTGVPFVNTNCRVVLVITPANPIDALEPVTTAQVVRVRGYVEWREGRRNRSIAFDSTKLQRP